MSHLVMKNGHVCETLDEPDWGHTANDVRLNH